MATQKKGLGRNLNALLGGARPTTIVAKTTETDGRLRQLPIEHLQPGKYQPRQVMEPEALQELANSISTQGIIQPIVVRPLNNKRFEIIAGERRWRAAQLAQLSEVPVVIREIGDDVAILLALIENIQREDLNPMEEARALHRLQEEFDLTHQKIAEAVGKSRATVTNLLRLMSLNHDVKLMLEHGDIEMGHARALLALDEADQVSIAKTVEAKGLSVRETERLVRQIQEGDTESATKTLKQEDPDIRNLQDDLSEKLCAKVNIQHKSSGKGKLVITYHSVDELEGIIAHL